MSTLDVKGLDHVWVLQCQTEGVWWLVGIFATKPKAAAHRDVNYVGELTRIQRRMVQ